MPNEAERLRDYILSISPPFEKHIAIHNYNHISAILAAAVLQSNNNYERNVRHRIKRIREIYADDRTLADLRRLLTKITVQEFLAWNGTRKTQTFVELVDLLDSEGVNTGAQLREWLEKDSNCAKLRAIRYIGRKTVNYLKQLAGLPVAAIDIRLRRFLELAGLGKLTDERAEDIIHRAADLMGWDEAHLDHSIWRYMASHTAESIEPRLERSIAEP